MAPVTVVLPHRLSSMARSAVLMTNLLKLMLARGEDD
jgi:hypothetical protein